MLARVGTPTGDGRIIAPGALTNRDLPLPLMWQERTEDGHGGSMVIATIETLSYDDPAMVRATGTLLESAPASAVEQIEAGVIGPSVDLDDVEYVMDADERIVITQGRIAGATLVSVPAFADVSITLDAAETEPEEQPGYAPLFASAAPVERPPADWFRSPDVDRLTPLTVTDTGRVFGHIAGWDTCHVGLPGCVTAPPSPTDYSRYHLHVQELEDGTRIPVGVMTVGGGHAAANLGWRAAIEHYDNVGAAVAKVRAGEDEYGIWVAGWLLPQATPEQREAFMSSPVSGDWRSYPEGLDLTALCSVNNPGFPVPRARVSFALGEQRALVASLATPQTGGVVERRRVDPRVLWAWSTTERGD